MLKVKDLMTTQVLSLKPRNSIAEARAQMQAADIRHLPVVDDRGHVIGILSNRDVLRAGERKAKAPVAEIMTKQIHSVRPETPAHEAASLMIEHKIGSLPVIGEEEQIVGVVTETDFLKVARDALLGRRLGLSAAEFEAAR
jgi:CBS domain-containing protein